MDGRRKTDPAPLGSLLARAHRQVARAGRIAVDADTWERVVGTRIAERARAGSAQGQVLTVEVASAVWAQELSLLSADILEKLREAGFAFRELRFKVTENARRPAPIPRKQAPSITTLPEDLANRLTDVDDMDLRRTIAEAAALSLALPRASATSAPPAAPGPRSAAPESARSGQTGAAKPEARRRNRGGPEG
jgi:hypothetical protein